MDDSEVMRSMVRDDAYRVVRVLADGPSGKTELVTLGGTELLVRKRIPTALANATAWATVMGLRAPRLPRIEEIYQMPDELVVVYSYVEGRSLREMVDAQGALPPHRAVEMIEQVCEAVAVLHDAGLVHRDITPGNVILARDGAHLVDLGIARQQKQDSLHDTSVLGTWGFAAPEQFGFAQTDHRSDVYALGRLLGYALTGLVPATEAYERALADPARVPAPLAQVSAQASSFEPSARYQSAHELAKEAKKALAACDASARASYGNKGSSASVLREDVANGSMPLSPTAASWKLPPEPESEPAPQMPADAGWEEAASARRAPQASPRQAPSSGSPQFHDAPLLARVAAVIVWSTCAVWVLLVAATCVSSLATGDPNWHLPQYAMGVVSCAGVIMAAREVRDAATCAGRYENERHIIWSCVKEVCKILGITFVMMLLCALLPSGQ